MSKCECGCGQETDLSTVTGKPNKYVHGHNRRGVGGFSAHGRWSVHYDCCIECGTTEKKHSRDGYCSNCVRRALRSGKINIKRDLKDGKWSREYDRCIDCGTTEIRYKANGRCEHCDSKKRVRDLGKKNRNFGGWSWYYDRCVHCGTTEVPHSARGLCEICHKRERCGSLDVDEVRCPVCGALVGKLDQHISMRSKSCSKHLEHYSRDNDSIVSMFSSKMTSGDVAKHFKTDKRRVLQLWHDNFSDEDIIKRGERIRVSKISGENNYLYGTVPHTNITKLIPFDDKNGRFFMMRSSWEVKYAQYLDANNIKWDFEPHKFKYYDTSGGAHYYFPDFYIPIENAYIEIKGYYSEFSRYKVEECVRLYGLNIKVLEKEDLLSLGIAL